MHASLRRSGATLRGSEPVRRVAIVVVGAFLAGCLDMNILGPREGRCPGMNFQDRPCIGLEVRPRGGEAASRILEGDTMWMHTFSDSGYGRAAWNIDGDAAAAVTDNGLAQTVVGPVTQILVRAVRAGRSTVTATHSRPGRSAHSWITVLDSNSVAKIVVNEVAGKTIRVGDSLWVIPTLQDSAGMGLRGAPDGWSSSDSTVATVSQKPPMTCTPASFVCFPAMAFIHGRSAGTATITASFLQIRTRIAVTIAP